MSDGPCFTGEGEGAGLNFRDLEKQKWLAMREDCPCRVDGYCECNTDARCAMELCAFHYWSAYR